MIAMLARNPHTDYPKLRAFPNCANCGLEKPHSALLCWSCFNRNSLEGRIDCDVQAKIDRAEANLITSEYFQRDYPRIAAIIERIGETVDARRRV